MKLRNMTCIYIQNGNKLLMIFKTKSRFGTSPKWTGIGGHFEENELNDPDNRNGSTAAVYLFCRTFEY